MSTKFKSTKFLDQKNYKKLYFSPFKKKDIFSMCFAMYSIMNIYLTIECLVFTLCQ